LEVLEVGMVIVWLFRRNGESWLNATVAVKLAHVGMVIDYQGKQFTVTDFDGRHALATLNDG
jgi:hypothetical protein